MKVTAALRAGIAKSRGLVDEIRSDVSQPRRRAGAFNHNVTDLREAFRANERVSNVARVE